MEDMTNTGVNENAAATESAAASLIRSGPRRMLKIYADCMIRSSTVK